MGTEQLPLDGAASRPPPKPARDIRPPTPTEQRRLLVNGTADLHRSFPPAPGDTRTAEELVDDALAKGVVQLHTQEALLDQHDAAEQDAAAALANGTATLDLGAGSGGRFRRRDMVLCPAQDQIEVAFDEHGDLTMTQRSSVGESEDQTILVARGNIEAFIDLLTDALGIPSFP